MKKILKIEEVAAILRVGPYYVRKLIREKQIPAYKQSNKVGFRVLEEDVERYIDRRFKDNETD